MTKISLSGVSACCQTMTTRMRLPSSAAHKLGHMSTAPRAIHTLCRSSPLWNTPSNTQKLARAYRTGRAELGTTLMRQLSASLSTTARRSDDKIPAAQKTTQQQQAPTITWDEFLKLRRRRRYVNLVASVGTAVGSVAAAVPVAMQYEVEDRIASVTGLDPFIAFGLMITAVGGFGWLMGPFVGNAGFLLWNRSIRGEIAKRERDFYNHIRRFRADPTSSSVSNPVPDYYGEKITSVADYRRWLKDQRAFNRKKSKNLL
ncbi:Pam17-domain-containing protein [Myriangium duriaei CBS 260.36]|uniref:Presequence translocated-associated motor subunit PAM17 n=1 Tax=Myriangium duriaei CBS 260.36 TaxID=1168546 RepID=A0A9P4ML90_9PEZI|nr:Pam17-domain-containing protein [Myriangium duriaei CBS 260.36]